MSYAAQGRGFAAGLCAGVAFLANAKAVFVLASLAVWLSPDLAMLCAGFAVPVAAGALLAFGFGALPGYLEQVWRWSWIYAAASPISHPFFTGVAATLNWLGFHAALALPAAFALMRLRGRQQWTLAAWLVISFAAVCLGFRFAPRYYLQLLPPMVILAARGLVIASLNRRRVVSIAVAVLLLIPLVRFGPRYATLAYDNLAAITPQWSDIARARDSRQVANQILAAKLPGDTLFVWGYRPDIYVYTRLPFASRFWDSQPLTGVPADRHLIISMPVYGGPAAANRQGLERSHPTWIVDGLGLLNPKLRPQAYPELRRWLAAYQLAGRTKLSLIYRRGS